MFPLTQHNFFSNLIPCLLHVYNFELQLGFNLFYDIMINFFVILKFLLEDSCEAAWTSGQGGGLGIRQPGCSISTLYLFIK